jgi:hypothetical protein
MNVFAEFVPNQIDPDERLVRLDQPFVGIFPHCNVMDVDGAKYVCVNDERITAVRSIDDLEKIIFIFDKKDGTREGLVSGYSIEEFNKIFVEVKKSGAT